MNMWRVSGAALPPPPAPAEMTTKVKEELEKAAKQHTDLMYANTQLLKTIKYASIAMGLGVIALFTLYWMGRNSNSAPVAQAPMAPPPMAPPQTV